MAVADAAFWTISLVLMASGATKVSDPRSFSRDIEPLVRLKISSPTAIAFGLGEVVVGGAALSFGDWPLALVVALLYVLFAGLVAMAIRSKLPSCGCFGAASAEPTGVHLGLNVASVAVAVVAAIRRSPGMAEGLTDVGGPAAILISLGVILAAAAIIVLDTRNFGSVSG